MTNEERDIISQFIARVGGAPAPSGFAAGSVPATQSAPLPPVDRDADTLIAQMFQRLPRGGLPHDATGVRAGTGADSGAKSHRRDGSAVARGPPGGSGTATTPAATATRRRVLRRPVWRSPASRAPAAAKPRVGRAAGRAARRNTHRRPHNMRRSRRNTRPVISPACSSAAARDFSARR